MITPEAAAKQLEQWKVAEPNGRFLPEIARLPPKLRVCGYALQGRDAEGKEHETREKQTAVERKALPEFDALSPKDRIKLFRVYFGKLAELVESSFQWQKSSPYQNGYFRKAFRAPSLPEASLDVRVDWLKEMIELAEGYAADVLTPEFLAAWAPYLTQKRWGNYTDAIGRLLAPLISEETPQAAEVFDILRQSASNQHEIGSMGTHVTRALLSSSRREAHEFIEKMLLAAQRQEGLRQTILETIDEAHPQAFISLLKLIRDQNLARFSAVVRGLNVWVGLMWDSVSVKVINDSLTRILELLEKESARTAALNGKDAEQAFFALWAIAYHDAAQAIPAAGKLLKHKDPEMRMIAVTHLNQNRLPQTTSLRLQALRDPDLRIALMALSGGWSAEEEDVETEELSGDTMKDLFEELEALFERLPEKSTKLKPLVWPWTEQVADREQLTWTMLSNLGDRSPTRLLPYLPWIKSYQRSRVVQMLAAQKKWDAVTRETLVELVGDAGTDVRAAACEALGKAGIKTEEAPKLEGYLTRKAGDVRRNVVGLLLKQKDQDALASAERLTTSKDANQRLAGLELWRHLAEGNRQRKTCMTKAAAWREGRSKVTADEETHLKAIAESDQVKITLDNALGLMDPAQRSPVVAPKARKVVVVSPAAIACLKALDDLIHAHREEKFTIERYDGPQEVNLGTMEYGFRVPNWNEPLEQQLAQVPALPLWEEWYANRPASQRDKDGLELVRAALFLDMTDSWDDDDRKMWLKKHPEREAVVEFLNSGQKRPKLRYDQVIDSALAWLNRLHPSEAVIDWGLDVTETLYTLVPQVEMEKLKGETEWDRYSWGDEEPNLDWRCMEAFMIFPEKVMDFTARQTWSPEQKLRHWELQHWRDEPFPGACRTRPDWDLVRDAYALKSNRGPNRTDLIDQLLGPKQRDEYGNEDYDTLRSLSDRRPSKADDKFLKEFPEVRELVDAARERLLQVELARGDASTVATKPAAALLGIPGVDNLVRILTVLGKTPFKVVSSWRDSSHNRASSFTHLVKATYPRPGEDAAAFSAAIGPALKAGAFPEERLLQLVFLAPQWAKMIEQHLEWPGICEGLYWFLAHMRYVYGATDAVAADDDEGDADASAEGNGEVKEKPSAWNRLIAERTPLSEQDRSDGAIDVGWFQRTYDLLTPKRWQALTEAAKFAANSNQARRAQFIADVLLGKASRKDLIAGVRTKKLKDYVRMLGLLPLPVGPKRDGDLMERYKALQEYRKYARTLSSMSKPDAMRAIEIGFQNLASTAGFPDPLRLEWALEAEAVRDLAEGPVSVSKDGVTVTLSLDDQSQPQMSVLRDGKTLKSIPPAVKKDKKVAALSERVSDLKKQASRMKWSLESAMLRGDTFSAAELVQLCNHAVLAPLLSRLVLVGEGIMGYPDKKGKVLRSHTGKSEPLKKAEQLRIAHCTDLFQSGDWDKWQHECFHAERVQPFKQIFRELYVVTKAEKDDSGVSKRYSGQQINPQQAYALWGSRGWNTKEGDVFKVFFDLGMAVAVDFQYLAGTPGDVEGLTIDGVRFYNRDDYKPMPLAKVPPRVFSEVMRDVDLVVSVAHRGGVDPEASQSTVEMRAALLNETCDLLGLKNVRVKSPHVLIDGKLANYSLHLGSANVHRMPGGAVCIVPVNAQHRGRLFLPFADNDPRTAEVISKAILLANDHEIQDPTILDQLRRV